uniref:Uncharacterized protein n=1 Tax=Coccidioides posadasii RMSCC 3488 TaxID=454284 RepID=A0A0J6FBB0_COCPO|nr:hypothetical protein CPAG_02565 [Coccidioides posadasii RMSCC 3488]
MDLTRLSTSELQGNVRSLQISSADENHYCETVLLLPEGQTEDNVDNRLLGDARALGLTVCNDGSGSYSTEDPREGNDGSSISSQYALPSTITLSPTRMLSSFSTPWSLKERISSSRHSIASLSTCPTTCSISESEPRQSIADFRPTRHSLNLEGIDRGFKFGLKHAISRIPNLRRRKGSALGILPSTTPSELSSSPSNGLRDIRQGRSLDINTTESLASRDTLAPIDEGCLRRSLVTPELKAMRAAHEGQMQRYLIFRRKMLVPILRGHRRTLEETKSRHIKAVEDLVAQNSQKAVRREERDLMAELSLTEEFKREKQALQSRIRYMEAYFITPPPETQLGDNSAESRLPQRRYSKEYRDLLRQKQHELATMDSLHESKIKVLRDTQAKHYENALKKWEQDVRLLEEANERDLRDLENRCREEKDVALGWLEAKRARLQARWMLEESILRKKLEIDTQEYYSPLPKLSFGDIGDDTSIDIARPSNDQQTVGRIACKTPEKRHS